MTMNIITKCSIHRIRVVSKPKRSLISVESGMSYHNSNTTVPHQTASSLHFITSFQSKKALKLWPPTQTPNHQALILF